MQERVVHGSVRVLRFIERVARPRRSEWMRWRAVRLANSVLVAFMAFLLALPLPPFPPLTNTCPGYSIIFLAVAMMEDDGLLIWVGYAAALGTTMYFAFMAHYIGAHTLGWLQALGRLFGLVP